MTREKIFQIMGKYYGNAYYGHYDESTYEGPPISEKKLIVLKTILDEFNSLGYHISNLHKLSYIEDIRFVEIIVRNVNKYSLDGPMASLLFALNRLSYYEATPDVLKWYQDKTYKDASFGLPGTPSFEDPSNRVRWCISNAAYAIRNRKYMTQYMGIIRDPEYGKTKDLLIEIPLTYKNREALELLLKMQDQYGIWGWDVTQFVPRFKDASLIPELEKLLESPDREIRTRARRGIKKLKEL